MPLWPAQCCGSNGLPRLHGLPAPRPPQGRAGGRGPLPVCGLRARVVGRSRLRGALRPAVPQFHYRQPLDGPSALPLSCLAVADRPDGPSISRRPSPRGGGPPRALERLLGDFDDPDCRRGDCRRVRGIGRSRKPPLGLDPRLGGCGSAPGLLGHGPGFLALHYSGHHRGGETLPDVAGGSLRGPRSHRRDEAQQPAGQGPWLVGIRRPLPSVSNNPRRKPRPGRRPVGGERTVDDGSHNLPPLDGREQHARPGHPRPHLGHRPDPLLRSLQVQARRRLTTA